MFNETAQRSRTKSWLMLLFFSFLIWLFGWQIGPYIEKNIPTYKQIAHVIEERDIDSAAYMYEDSVGSYDGEYYLRDSFELANSPEYGMTKSFLAGMALCFIILAFGWRFVMK